MQIHAIETGYFKLDGGAMFGVVPKVIWQRLNEPDAKNLCTWSMRCMLIENEGKLILIDTGLGNKQSEKFFSYYEPHGEANLIKSINEKGYSAEDVTDVILTHLHFDHCGGAISIKDGKPVPTFKNAMYWSEKTHWDWASTPNGREKASFLKENFKPLEANDQIRFINAAAASPFTNISFKTMFGHTEAMLIPHINYKGKTIVYMADLLPSVAHIPLPYIMGYDIRAIQTLKEKTTFLEEAQKNDYILFFEHDKSNECCNLKNTEKGVRANEIFKLSEI